MLFIIFITLIIIILIIFKIILRFLLCAFLFYYTFQVLSSNLSYLDIVLSLYLVIIRMHSNAVTLTFYIIFCLLESYSYLYSLANLSYEIISLFIKTLLLHSIYFIIKSLYSKIKVEYFILLLHNPCIIL